MNCFTHPRVAAVGICTACQKGICRDCVGRAAPRLVCASCAESGALFGYEYRSAATIAGWPLVHVCTGVDASTMRPKVAKGVIAVGNIAVGGVALGGVAFGLVSVGGVSLGLLGALGGVAIGVGLSIGGVAVGSVAAGGAAIGFAHAIGGAAFGPSIIDGTHCGEATRDLVLHWFGTVPPSCR